MLSADITRRSIGDVRKRALQATVQVRFFAILLASSMNSFSFLTCSECVTPNAPAGTEWSRKMTNDKRDGQANKKHMDD
jgi:hypothetical protein